jgi:PEGA domain
MVRRLAGALALACAAAMVAGCATIVHGTTEKVYVDSTPAGAEVNIDDSEQAVTTPAEVKLSRASAHKLVFHKAGYEDATENLTSSFSGWILGNVLAGGAVGMVVDAADGASHSLSADSVNVKLTPLPAPPVAKASPVPKYEAAIPPAALVQMLDTVAPPAAQKSRAAPAQPEGPPPEHFTDDE